MADAVIPICSFLLSRIFASSPLSFLSSVSTYSLALSATLNVKGIPMLHRLLSCWLMLVAGCCTACCTLLHPTPLHTRLAQGHSRHVGARRAKPQAPQAYCTYTRAYHYAAPFFSKPRFPHFHSQARKRAKTCVTAGTEPGAAATARLQLTTLPPFFFFSNRTIWQPA